MRHAARISLLNLVFLLVAQASSQSFEPLASWNDGPAKQSIIDFVQAVTTEGSPDFVPKAERIATFDNDGCLWSEQPVYFQLIFAMDRVNAMADEHPEWKTTQPFQAVLEGDHETLTAAGKEGLAQLIMASHAGMTTDEFNAAVRDWLDTARHPRFDRPYHELTYRPMVELLVYLRVNGFKTFIVSGGGIDFLRVFAEEAYGIPPEQVVGTSLKTAFELRDGVPILVKQPEINFIDDKAGKPVGHPPTHRPPPDLRRRQLRRRPADAPVHHRRRRTSLRPAWVHHTDAEREWAYDRESHIGKLDQALDEAGEKGWTVVDMAADWKTIYASE